MSGALIILRGVLEQRGEAWKVIFNQGSWEIKMSQQRMVIVVVGISAKLLKTNNLQLHHSMNLEHVLMAIVRRSTKQILFIPLIAQHWIECGRSHIVFRS